MLSRRPFSLSLVLLAAAAAAPAQTYSIKYLKNRPITYSDGYKTALDIRYPDAKAPANGWPTAMIVHGGGGNRTKGWVVTMCEHLTRKGYVTLAYDTGNNGVTVKVNPPGRRKDTTRMRDVAEIFYFAKQALGSRMDHNRLAMMGKSGGGKHTLWGASYSGKKLPVGSKLVTNMPKILAAHSDIQVLDFISENLLHDDIMRSDWMVKNVVKAGVNDPLSKLMLALDYAGMKKALAADPAINFFPHLRTSDVPLLVSYATTIGTTSSTSTPTPCPS